MAASVRGLALPPPLASPRTSSRCLAPVPRGRSRSQRRVAGVRAAAAGVGGTSRAPEPVEVVGVGSRKDAVIDFCLGSRTLSSTPIRFWTVHATDSSKVQLKQKGHGNDAVFRDLEPPLFLRPCPPAVILVSSAGQDADHITAMELLSAVKSAGKLAASIFLKPFCFEGQRRQVEASDLIGKLQTCSNFHIVIEADSLLETEVETLAEALESANNAVLSTISMISIMMSGYNQMFWSSLNAQIKEVDPEEVAKLLRSYGEARVGFGAGYNIQSAIKQAVFHCPFLRGCIKDLNNVVFLSLTTARVLSESDMISTLHIFRRVTGFTKDIIFSRNSEPDLEPKLIVVSLLTIRNCHDENIASVKEGFLSSLAVHFPFISSLMGGDISEQKQAWSNRSINQLPDNGSNSAEREFSQSSNGFTDATVSKMFPEEIEVLKSERNGRIQPESLEADFLAAEEMSKDENRDHLGSQQEHNFWSNSPGFGIAQLWAKERITENRGSQNDELHIVTLPVGVKSSEVQNDRSPNTQPETPNSGTSVATGHAAFGVSLSDVRLDKVMDMCSSAVTFLSGRMDRSRKRGSIASRAAQMLNAEREPEKTWSPIVEIRYGGGTYIGRCQEGAPEGKGRLTFSDGSVYDGFWRYGKRSGLGTLFHSNGDVYHGTWRDDLIHGKGWYYFHSGDRWFANFWKGKANGEGRFYAKDGSIFFGHFQNGWRHGESLLVDANGSRWIEVWDEGVLIGRAKMEK
ncbi:protein ACCUMULATION AND REPLICATION OF CHLOROPLASTS 3, chloroplastic-like isoform X2 [Phragmites australis]|uniref:protein ACCUMULATION AND REPLICATION OF CHLOROPLASTS 3, chloroplastic-like isoform X2 n=1 Tax=Phragmites australis TaxID=29695 RepID=UPI002D76C5DC|nr:protein ACCUMULATION AND REPLICATION OF CHLOROPLASTS 3, chloroplastic-like isoform X2 [Phragmites australis]